jgi:hypothetical protein
LALCFYERRAKENIENILKNLKNTSFGCCVIEMKTVFLSLKKE